MTMTQEVEQTELPRILVVDDSKVMRLAAGKLLKDDFDVIVAEDGQAGWELIESDPTIQVVFSDLSMPHLDGFGLLDKVRSAESSRIRELPIIIVTGAEDDDSAREKVLAAGATDFITKPFNSIDLKARASSHANASQVSTELREQTESPSEEHALDSVTGLINRQVFEEGLSQIMSYSRRHQEALSVVRIDIDQFNRLFIKLGRKRSNAILRKLASVIRKQVREEDQIARIGMSRFAITLSSADKNSARLCTDRILKRINSVRFKVGEEIFQITASIGVIVLDAVHHPSTESVMTELGELVSDAASQGGNVVMFNQSNDGQAVEDIAMPNLEEAVAMIEDGQLDRVMPAMEHLLKRLEPLLALASDEQVDRLRAQLARRLSA